MAHRQILRSRMSSKARKVQFNPAHGLIANLRQAMLGGPIDAYSLAVSTAASALLLVAGCLYFRRVERDFADII